MKKNKILKITLIILMIASIFLISNASYGWTPDFSPYENDAAGGNASNAVTSIMGAAVNIVSIVAAGVAIIILIVIGITYLTKSPEGKADAKKSLTSYVIGAVLMFAASGILRIIQMFIDSNVNKI